MYDEPIYEKKSFAEINLTALAHNYTLLARRVKASGASPICVVKADAYGHGAPACVRALTGVGANFFAVSSVAEALEVRRAAPTADILILGYTRPANAPLLARQNITQTVHNAAYAMYLHTALDAAKAAGVIPAECLLKIHLKADSGMNRLGFPLNDTDYQTSLADILSVFSYRHLSPTGIFTHFACADEPSSPLTDCQLTRFTRVCKDLSSRGYHLRRHAANSAAALRFGSMGFDYVRLGIALYGLPPSDEVPCDGLCPVMSLYSRISEIHLLRKGESISYGACFEAPRDMRVATVSIGYADGLVRAASDGGYLIVGGHKAPILGRICMDQCMIGLDDIEAYEGDLVTVYDENGENIRHLANTAGTIPYELLCLTGLRVHRQYKQ